MTNIEPELYDALAGLLSYPREGFAEKATDDVVAIVKVVPETAAPLSRFVNYLQDTPAWQLEEQFTQVFEINPQCCLEIGWQVYGEQYNRGVFLVQMRELLRSLNLPEGSELPDHLTNVLPVLGRIDPVDAAILAKKFIAPAVERMTVALAADDHVYLGVLDAILAVLSHTAEHYQEPVA